MHLVATILFSFSACIDNIAVGLAYGIKKVRIDIMMNLLIALISALGTFIAMFGGKFLSSFISVKAANLAGSSILILIGTAGLIKYLYSESRKKRLSSLKNEHTAKSILAEEILENPEKADMDSSGNIDIKEALILGFALAINNIGLSLGAGIAGMNLYFTTIFTFFISALNIRLGYYISSKFLSDTFRGISCIISFLIIVALGIYELF